jgi:hypothetical protein
VRRHPFALSHPFAPKRSRAARRNHASGSRSPFARCCARSPRPGSAHNPSRWRNACGCFWSGPPPRPGPPRLERHQVIDVEDGRVPGADSGIRRDHRPPRNAHRDPTRGRTTASSMSTSRRASPRPGRSIHNRNLDRPL